jgi:hypothetical protein
LIGIRLHHAETAPVALVAAAVAVTVTVSETATVRGTVVTVGL